MYDELFHHAESDDLKSVGIAFDGGGIGGVEILEGGVLTPEVVAWASEDMMDVDRGDRYRVILAAAILAVGYGVG